MKKKFSGRRMLWLLGGAVVLAVLAAPHYIWTVERAKAGAAEAALVNVVIAENLYFLKHKTYTDDWQRLEPYISEIAKEQGVFAPAPEPGEERFFAFAEPDLQDGGEGFSFGIEVAEDATAGKIYAVRAGKFFSYTLSDSFPSPQFACEADSLAGRWLCDKFTAYIEPFLMRKKADAASAPDPAPSGEAENQ